LYIGRKIADFPLFGHVSETGLSMKPCIATTLLIFAFFFGYLRAVISTLLLFLAGRFCWLRFLYVVLHCLAERREIASIRREGYGVHVCIEYITSQYKIVYLKSLLVYDVRKLSYELVKSIACQWTVRCLTSTE
jgi:hypothetical protein